MSMIWIMKETYIRDTLCNGGIIDGKKNDNNRIYTGR